jgi:hypothetical protein
MKGPKKEKKGLHLKILLFSNMYRIQIVQILPNYHPRGDLISHQFFLFIEILEAISVDQH